ncbi:ribosomal protein L11 methyltransferase [Croceifilum oryzae]|uniref:Ribosomal protein L11 methyltransferase n=1 Tax=Croceifilum oryzae TaxID=1553429 RepID=A0AAJ1TCB3_9BACL|nr:ribosomal protein L11 methyltransferase [Croceifilum oryzae]
MVPVFLYLGGPSLKWTEVCVHTTNEAVEAVSNLLIELGADGVSIEDSEVLTRNWTNQYGEIIDLNPDDYPAEGVRIKTYLPEMVSGDEFISQVKAGLQNIKESGLDVGLAKVTGREVDEEDWANEWKQYYKPIRVTEKLTIKPFWEEYTPTSEAEQVIELDPGMAFGTGTHPTTTLSMKLMEKYLHPNCTVVDVGCGSGILSIAAVKLGAKQALALDLDPIAVKSASENVVLNGVEEIVQVKEADLLKGMGERTDVVVANILAEIIVLFTHDLPRVLVPGGIFIGSGIIEEKADLVIQSLKTNGLQILETVYQDGWVAIAAKKW